MLVDRPSELSYAFFGAHSRPSPPPSRPSSRRLRSRYLARTFFPALAKELATISSSPSFAGISFFPQTTLVKSPRKQKLRENLRTCLQATPPVVSHPPLSFARAISLRASFPQSPLIPGSTLPSQPTRARRSRQQPEQILTNPFFPLPQARQTTPAGCSPLSL